jgi:hypothetical protein
MTDSRQPGSSRRISLALSVLVVFLCLLGTAAFIGWYVATGSTERTIVLKTPVVESPSIGQPTSPNPRMALPPMQPGQPGFNGQRRFGNRPIYRRFGGFIQQQRDGYQVIAGQFLLNVRAATRPGGPPEMEMRLNGYGAVAMPMPPIFALVRRAVHEDVIAQELTITPDQMKALVALAENPAIRGQYAFVNPALPLSDQDLALLRKDWEAYRLVNHVRGPEERAVETDAAMAGTRSVQVVRAIYANLAAKVPTILTARQIALYNALITGRVRPAGIAAPSTRPTQSPPLIINLGIIIPATRPATQP